MLHYLGQQKQPTNLGGNLTHESQAAGYIVKKAFASSHAWHGQKKTTQNKAHKTKKTKRQTIREGTNRQFQETNGHFENQRINILEVKDKWRDQKLEHLKRRSVVVKQGNGRISEKAQRRI